MYQNKYIIQQKWVHPMQKIEYFTITPQIVGIISQAMQ